MAYVLTKERWLIAKMTSNPNTIAITCKQFTYDELEIKAASTEELVQTLKCITDLLPQLIGNLWPSILRASAYKINAELMERAQKEGKAPITYLLEGGVVI